MMDSYRQRAATGDKAPPTATTPRNQTPVGGQAGIEVVAPNGKTYTFPNQAQADVFKKRAGIR
jgi:hypothetical protein